MCANQQELLLLAAWLKTEFQKDPAAAASGFIVDVCCETKVQRQKVRAIGLPTLWPWF